MRILLVEDDPMIGESIEESLDREGYAVDWMRTGEDAHTALMVNTSETYDALILDLGLPGRSGESVLRFVRERGLSLPVLILSAKDAPSDRVRGLDNGADDYLNKPFDLDELYARIRALLRRSAGRLTMKLVHGQITLDPATHIVVRNGEEVPLTMREYMVFKVLMDQPDRVKTHDRLREAIYTMNEEISSNTVEVYIHTLRKKLGAEVIRNVRGVGYKLGPAT